MQEENREVGVSPARSRHCKRGARSITTGSFPEGASDVLIRKPGDLPVVMLSLPCRRTKSSVDEIMEKSLVTLWLEAFFIFFYLY